MWTIKCVLLRKVWVKSDGQADSGFSMMLHPNPVNPIWEIRTPWFQRTGLLKIITYCLFCVFFASVSLDFLGLHVLWGSHIDIASNLLFWVILFLRNKTRSYSRLKVNEIWSQDKSTTSPLIIRLFFFLRSLWSQSWQVASRHAKVLCIGRVDSWSNAARPSFWANFAKFDTKARNALGQPTALFQIFTKASRCIRMSQDLISMALYGCVGWCGLCESSLRLRFFAI